MVNGYTHVSPAMRERVQAVLDETGYRPNLAARNLRAGRTGVIALALAELANPYFAELTRSVVEAAEEHHLRPISASSPSSWVQVPPRTQARSSCRVQAAYRSSPGRRSPTIRSVVTSPGGPTTPLP